MCRTPSVCRWTALRTAQGERGDEAAKADVLGGAGDSGSDAALPHGEQRAALGPTMLLGEGQPHGDGNVSVAATAACGLCGRSPGASLSFVGPLGLVALVPEVTPRALAEGVAEAEAFARDWAELRAVSRNRSGRGYPWGKQSDSKHGCVRRCTQFRFGVLICWQGSSTCVREGTGATGGPMRVQCTCQ